jgi:catechol 2,3-dioxygenase-like lactoylglutathione lyase family enzyme
METDDELESNLKKTNPVLGGGGLHHAAVKTRDWNRTMRFYQEILGFTVKIAWGAAPARAIFLDAGDGSYLEVFEDLAFAPVPNGSIVHFCLRTSRIDSVCEDVRAFGAKISMEPKDATLDSTNGAGLIPIRLCFFEGPSGEVIELLQGAD